MDLFTYKRQENGGNFVADNLCRMSETEEEN